MSDPAADALPPRPSPGAAPDLHRTLRRAAPPVVFLLFLAFLGPLFARFPVLYDTDSYYHLAIGRLYARQGVVDALPWARLSVFHDGFGDKELLFHLSLAPFAAGDAPTVGGRWALAVWNALLAALLAYLGVLAVGPWGLAVPLLVYGGSLEMLTRAVRLRPELASLALLLVATWAAGRGRYRSLGAIAALYALAYTAFQTLLGLALGWFLVRGIRARQWQWRLLLYPLLGVGAGLLLHPHFPHNLVVWKLQNVDFFRLRQALDVGPEIRPGTTRQLLLASLPLWAALAALWGARRRSPAGAARDEPLADLFLVDAAAFALLYLLAVRFAIYALPMVTLAVLFAAGRRGGLGSVIPLPGRGRLPLAVAIAAALAVGGWRAGSLLASLATAQGEVPREVEWAAFGAAVPAGARVAADWGSAELYMFWAPQASYLNVLDPVFMAVPFPAEHRTLRQVLSGGEPDVPLAVGTSLGSDHLALSRFHPSPGLLDRLAADPRLSPLYRGYTLLYRLEPGANRGFVLDWRLAPGDAPWPPGPATDTAGWPLYPRADDPAGRALEGYVDATRVAPPSGCVRFVRSETVERPVVVHWELAPWGPATLWLDGRRRLTSHGVQRAVVGSGSTLRLALAPGTHQLAVESCAAGEAPARSGFYLLRRGVETPSAG